MARLIKGATAVALGLSLAAAARSGEALHVDLAKDASTPTLVYDDARGYGFEPGSPRSRFSMKAGEGNFRVTARFTRAPPASGTLIIRAEQRRHMFTTGPDADGRAWPTSTSFVVNVRTPALPALPENATGGSGVALKSRELGSATWDDKLSLEFSPDAAAIESLTIEAVSVPTLYLAGDSTVTDQPLAPNGSWGQFLTLFFDDRIALANHAESGETLKSFVTEMRLAKLLSTLRGGDWVMIQFGHNDQKTQWPQTYADADSTYRAWLRTYIAEIRRSGATPLLVTSPERRNFDERGHIVPSLGGYPEAMRAVARDEHVALIDLNAMSIRYYEALGPERAPAAFADQGRDHTHHSAEGAWSLASLIVAGLRAADPALTAGLENHLRADLPTFDPAHPAAPPPL